MLSQLVTSGALAAVIGLLGVALKLVFDYWNDSRWDKSMLRMLEIRDKLEEGSSSPEKKGVIEGEIDRLISKKESKGLLANKVWFLLCPVLLVATGIILIVLPILSSGIRDLFRDILEIYSFLGWEFTGVEVALQIAGSLVLFVVAFVLFVSCTSKILERKINSWSNSRKRARNKKKQASENVNAQEGTQ